MEYVEHLAWLLFLRALDAMEDEWEVEAQLNNSQYERILSEELRWSEWARRDWPADELLPFIHGRLIPYLQNLSGTALRETIRSVFSERNVIVCASPYNLKDVLEIIDEINFNNQDDVFTVSVVYEDLLETNGQREPGGGRIPHAATDRAFHGGTDPAPIGRDDL